MRPTWLAFATGLLPIAGTALSFWFASATGDVPGCIPFFEGCTSISATGRYFPASLIFNAAMLFTAPLTILFWILAYRWLQTMGATPGKGIQAILLLGVIAGLFLVLYVSFLGTHGEVYSFLRRFGVTVYFGFTYLAQAFITRALWRMRRDDLRPPLWCMFALLLGQLAAGLTSVFADLLRLDTDAVENVLEWNFALLMMLFFIACGWGWRRTGFVLRPAVR